MKLQAVKLSQQRLAQRAVGFSAQPTVTLFCTCTWGT